MSINLWTVKNNSWIVALGYVTYRLENYKKDKSKNPLRYELMMNEKEGDKGLQDVMMTQDYFSFSSFTIFSIVSPNSNVTG